MRALSLSELEREAVAVLQRDHYDYFAGGAERETTLRANEVALAKLGLIPRVLSGTKTASLECSLLGSAASMPVLVAPTAFHRLAHPDGECASARAAAAARAIFIVSMAATTSVEDIAAAARTADAPAPVLWFQLYIQSDLEFTKSIVRRAEAAGCRALVVSVDSPTFGRRERDLRSGFSDLPVHLHCENMREPLASGGYGAPRAIEFFAALSWEHIAWLRSVTKLPIVLKGIAHPKDAALAVQHGVDAIFVSNHGGRQLDDMLPAITLLPAIVAAVDKRVPVFVDGGFRRGTDVLKAIALGAQAVALGRPILWGLAAGGENGVRHALELMREELRRALLLMGCASLDELARDQIADGMPAC